ncbi:MAG: PQQ-binding-like beta-propeller repeat protein, partial [Planctomycetota bacterium]
MAKRHDETTRRLWRWTGFALAGCLMGSIAWAEPSPGDAVEVREGDVWSPAEFLKQEGRRFQIRYDDGTEEWITADRLREVGGADAEPEASRRFRKGQDVELKKHSRWVDAEIKRASHPLYLVATKDRLGSNQFHWEWVDPDRLREPGEDHEGPDVFSQFGHSVHNDSIKDSLREAQAEYADHLKKESQTARDATGRRDPFAPPPFDHPVSKADRSRMQSIALGGGQWEEAVVDPGEPLPGPLRSLSITTRANPGSFFARPDLIEAPGRFALVVIRDEEPGKAKNLYVERFDLARGRSQSAAEFDFASLPRAISPDGQRLAGHVNGRGASSRARLDVWDWSGREPAHVISFEPGESGRRGADNLESIRFAGRDTVVVRTRSGAVSAWEATTGRGLWEANPPRGGAQALAISPGGAVAAVAGADEVWLLDAKTGRVRATLPSTVASPTALSFSQNGQTLVAGSADRLQAWDLEARVAHPGVAVAPSAGPSAGAGLVVFDDGTVVWRGQTFDPATGALGATYRLAAGFNAGVGLRLIGMDRAARDERRVLNVWALPVPQAEGVAAPRLILQRGDAVRIDTSGLEGSADLRRQATQQLTAWATARGLTVSRQAEVTLVAETTTRSEMEVYETDELFPSQRTQSDVRVDT